MTRCWPLSACRTRRDVNGALPNPWCTRGLVRCDCCPRVRTAGPDEPNVRSYIDEPPVHRIGPANLLRNAAEKSARHSTEGASASGYQSVQQ